jgi:hypothetical protein
MATRRLPRQPLTTGNPDLDRALSEAKAADCANIALSEAKAASWLLDEVLHGNLAGELRGDRDTRGWILSWTSDALVRSLGELESELR